MCLEGGRSSYEERERQGTTNMRTPDKQLDRGKRKEVKDKLSTYSPRRKGGGLEQGGQGEVTGVTVGGARPLNQRQSPANANEKAYPGRGFG